MRGYPDRQRSMLGLISIEARIPSDHPLRRIKRMADEELKKLSGVFNRMYSRVGRPSIAPERILKSLLLIALYSVRSERQFSEQLGYNLLFRWFLDMELEEETLMPQCLARTAIGCWSMRWADCFSTRWSDKPKRPG